MGLAKELYYTMMNVGYFAKQNKAPKSLAISMSVIVRRSLEEWRSDEKSMKRFATGTLENDDLRYKLCALDVDTCTALWKLIDLLEYDGSQTNLQYYSPKGY